MKTELDIEICTTLPGIFTPGSLVAVDLEIFGAEEGRLHRPTGEFASIQLTDDGKKVYVIRNREMLPLIMTAIQEATPVFQYAQFDITQLRRWVDFTPRFIYDTCLLDRILWSGYFDGFSLADLSRRYLQVYLEKDTRKRFIDASEMDEEMIRYSAYDVAATYRILQKQLKVARPIDLEIWKEYDLPALWAVLDFRGFPVNADKWTVLAERNRAQAESLKATFEFNPNAPAQVLKWFKDNGVKLKNTRKEVLDELDNPMAKRVREYRTIAKRSSTYGLNWLKKNVEEDGCIHAEYNISEAETSRMSAMGGMHQIPVRDTPEFRECFIAPPGYVLIIGDYSAQEPRIAAFLSQDELLLKIFNDVKKDVYVETAWLVYEQRVSKDHKLRGDCKSIFLGMDYGMTEYGLSRKVGCSEKEAVTLLNKFFNIFVGLNRWIQNKQSTDKDYVELATGRRIHLNKYHNQWKRNALNSPIQGTAAEITKRALRYLHENWPWKLMNEFGVVAVIHDEIVLLVPEEYQDISKQLLNDCMVKAAEDITTNVPAKADICVGKCWADKK